jgi:4-carboxymuconolactone decarboxylase
MTRLAYPDPAHVAEIMGGYPVPLRHMRIGRTVSHAPTLVAPYYATYAAVLQDLALDPRLRQLAILRVAEVGDAPYILAQHRAIARIAGLTDEQIAAAGERTIDNPCFTYVQKLVLAFADEVAAVPHVSDALFTRIESVLTPREIVELLLVIGWYWTACRLTTALEIEPEHAFGHGVLAMQQLEQAKRAGPPAGDPQPDDYLVY